MEQPNFNQTQTGAQPAPGAQSAQTGQVPPYTPPPFAAPPYGGQRPAYAPRLKWPPIAGNGFDVVFMILSLIFSVFAVHAVLFAGFFKLGFTAAYVLWFVLENIYIFSKNKPRLSLYPILLGALSLAASGVFSLYNDETVSFALLLFIAFSNASYFLLLSKQERFNAGEITAVADAFRYCLIIPFQFIAEPFRSAFTTTNSANGTAPKKKGKAKSTVQVLIGLAIALPIAAILIALLAKADPAFKGLTEKLFANILLSLLKLVLGILLFPVLLSPAFALRYKMPNRDYKAPKQSNLKRFPSAISVTVLAVVSLVYLVYLFAQLAYFFDAFKGILPDDYSVSAYARRGFFEMCAICAINALFIALSMAFAKRDSKGSTVVHKVLQVFICLVSLVITASSFSKMYLYIDLYGLTRKRVLTSVFMLMLAVVFISLIFRILIERFPYMKVVAVCCFAIMIAVGYLDIDSTIAKYNFKLYTENASITAHLEKDGGFIEELGDSAAPAVASFAKQAKGDVQNHAQSWLCNMWGRENVDDYYSQKLSKCDTPLSYNRARIASTAVFDAFNQEYNFSKYLKYIMDSDFNPEIDSDFNPEIVQKGLNPDYCYDYDYSLE